MHANRLVQTGASVVQSAIAFFALLISGAWSMCARSKTRRH